MRLYLAEDLAVESLVRVSNISYIFLGLPGHTLYRETKKAKRSYFGLSDIATDGLEKLFQSVAIGTRVPASGNFSFFLSRKFHVFWSRAFQHTLGTKVPEKRPVFFFLKEVSNVRKN